MNSARRRALRAVLSALAGGGLTAASLGGPLAGGALGSTAVATTSPEGPSTPVTTTNSGAVPQETTAGAPSSTTQTTPSTSTSGTSTAPHLSSPTPAGGSPTAVPEAPPVVLQRRQRITESKKTKSSPTATSTKPSGRNGATGAAGPTKAGAVSGKNNVAAPPQLVAEQAGALAAALASSAASTQALSFYRIPLFLLPIYQAASLQYGVPWQILAAINEIETNYGSDQSVSSAGAVGWMQFMPATWTQYGVDALNAGYADPYNPVDAIFAAARYLRAAGAAKDLRAAILAYNHSNEYADSVLLRAKLISTYPQSVIATLTGLVDDRPPVTGRQLAWGSSLDVVVPSPSSATANAVAVPGTGSSGPTGAPTRGVVKARDDAGSSAPPSPAAAARWRRARPTRARKPYSSWIWLSAPNAAVVAVQDGRIVEARKLVASSAGT